MLDISRASVKWTYGVYYVLWLPPYAQIRHQRRAIDFRNFLCTVKNIYRDVLSIRYPAHSRWIYWCLPCLFDHFPCNCAQRTSHFPFVHLLLTVRCHMAEYVYSVNMLSCLLGVYIIKWISDCRLNNCLADGKSVLIMLLFVSYGDRSLVLRKLKTIDSWMHYVHDFTEVSKS